jgi:hypothetical protein
MDLTFFSPLSYLVSLLFSLSSPPLIPSPSSNKTYNKISRNIDVLNHNVTMMGANWPYKKVDPTKLTL